MPNVVSETAHLLLVATFFVLILVSGRRYGLRKERGWRLVALGCGLMVLGSAFETSDHLFNGDLSFILGRANAGHVLEHIVGFTLIFFGLWQWIPSIGAVRTEKQQRPYSLAAALK